MHACKISLPSLKEHSWTLTWFVDGLITIFPTAIPSIDINSWIIFRFVCWLYPMRLCGTLQEVVSEPISGIRKDTLHLLKFYLGCIIRDEAAAGNRVAGRVHALHLDRNAITLVLPDWIAAADRDADTAVDDDDVKADVDSDEEEEAPEPPTSLARPWLLTTLDFALALLAQIM